MEKCKDCKFFGNIKIHEDGFRIGLCEKEPFDVANMNSEQMAIICGHDGGVWVGENFGCINFKKSNKKAEQPL